VSTNRFVRLIETFCLHEVKYVVVGGVAAVLQRVPINTMDFDVVYANDVENAQRLTAALAVLGTTHREDTSREVTEAELVLGQTLHCRAGRLDLDLMSTLGESDSYAALLPDTDRLEVAGYLVDVLKLEKLIQLKRTMSRPKDRFMLLHLEATLEERERMRD
jgi:hypothetical protein